MLRRPSHPLLSRVALPVAIAWALVSVPALAQGRGATPRSGVRARLVIADELLTAPEWPVSDERAAELRGTYRVRRPTGRGVSRPAREPNREVVVVIEGARGGAPAPRRITIEGSRFVPSEIVVTKPGEVLVENHQGRFVTLDRLKGGVVTLVNAGDRERLDLPVGEHRLTLREFPFARATVRVLDTAIFLRWNEDGEVPFVPVKAGDYKLAFYHGSTPLLVQPLSIPDDAVVAIDATISANGVVTVSLKDGGLQVARPGAR